MRSLASWPWGGFLASSDLASWVRFWAWWAASMGAGVTGGWFLRGWWHQEQLIKLGHRIRAALEELEPEPSEYRGTHAAPANR